MSRAWAKGFGLASAAAWGVATTSAEPPIGGGGMGSPNYGYRVVKKKDKKKVHQHRQNEAILMLLMM